MSIDSTSLSKSDISSVCDRQSSGMNKSVNFEISCIIVCDWNPFKDSELSYKGWLKNIIQLHPAKIITCISWVIIPGLCSPKTNGIDQHGLCISTVKNIVD